MLLMEFFIMGDMRTENVLDAGDLVIAVKDIVNQGIIFSKVLVPKGTPGVVIERTDHWFAASELHVKFDNGAAITLKCGENCVIGLGDPH
jgi:hypothetical protein